MHKCAKLQQLQQRQTKHVSCLPAGIHACYFERKLHGQEVGAIIPSVVQGEEWHVRT